MDEYTDNVLEQFTARQSDDDVKKDLELVHEPCGVSICDIQHGDTLAVLVRTALGHEETSCPAYDEDDMATTAEWFAASKAAGCTGTGYDSEHDTIEHANPGPCPVHPGLPY